jgi:hypothetical protein
MQRAEGGFRRLLCTWREPEIYKISGPISLKEIGAGGEIASRMSQVGAVTFAAQT